jgi:proline iminopeptidase
MKSKIIKTTKGLVYTIGSKKLKSLLNYRRNDLALIALHGGPGYPHDYLTNLFTLESSLPVLLYDQYGCGRSEKVKNINTLCVNDYIQELEEIRKFYKIDKLILYGHSWGTILALEYYIKYPDRVASILFVSPCISLPFWTKDSLYYINKLPPEDQKIIEEANKSYRYNSPKYLEIVDEYYKLCVFKERPKPEILYYCDQNSSAEVYGRFWGINEFTVTGILKNYDATHLLKELKVPSVFIAGEFDECLEETLKNYSSMTPNSTFQIIKGARHFPNLENPNELFPIVKDFLKNSLNR